MKATEMNSLSNDASDSPVVEARDLRKNFGSVQAVRGASFSIARGECFGLLGPNGAGKSTAIRILYGATSRSGGSLTVFGLDPAREAREIKKRLGVVTQENALDEDMGVRANMMMYARCVGLPRADRGKRVDELLRAMSLDHRANARIRNLSGGMQRRLVFVRALLRQPGLLVLDEPTTGLDPAVRLHMWERVRALKDTGTTVLLTTHYMDEAERLCDRLVIMNEGEIKAEGAPRELIDRHCPGTVAVFPKEAGLRERLVTAAAENPDFSWFEDRAGINVRGPGLAAVESFLGHHGMIPRIIRPSTLEDVFLEITGRELGGDA